MIDTRDALDVSLERRGSEFRTPVLAVAVGIYLPFELDVGGPENIKRGPYDDADPKDHGVAFSELHLSARLCASCHEFTE